MYLETFSKRLKDLMEWEDVSVRALSMAIQSDRKGIRGWLQGQYFPRWDALIKLADYFKVSVDFLVGLDERNEPEYEETFKSVTKEDVKASFLNRLKEFMQSNNLTIYAIAKGTQLDQKPVKNWLVKGSMPETLTLIRLARLMKCGIDVLLGRR